MAKGLKDKITETNLGYKGGRPIDFELGPNSTLHNTTSVDGKPPFSSYASPVIKSKTPTKIGFKQGPKYLDNLPS